MTPLPPSPASIKEELEETRDHVLDACFALRKAFASCPLTAFLCVLGDPLQELKDIEAVLSALIRRCIQEPEASTAEKLNELIR